MSEWVTDPKALDTLIALGGLKRGDEIIYCRAYGPGPHRTLREDQVMVIDDLHSWADLIGTVQRWAGNDLCVGISEGWVLTRKNIKAWRRP